jgi:tetratricopeptide (TPR) repeat protein
MARAQAYVQARQYGSAEALYTWLADSCPDSFEVLAEWAGLKETQGEYEAGIRLLQKAVTLAPQFRPINYVDQPRAAWDDFAVAEAYADLGDLLAKNGEMDPAIAAVERAIELHPPGTASPWQYQYLGILYYQAGQLDKAKQAFEAALAIEPNLPDSITYLQWIEEQQATTP